MTAMCSFGLPQSAARWSLVIPAPRSAGLSPCASLGRGGMRTVRTTLRLRGRPDPRRQPSPLGRGSGTGTLACL
jgi:hypothetical protein